MAINVDQNPGIDGNLSELIGIEMIALIGIDQYWAMMQRVLMLVKRLLLKSPGNQHDQPIFCI